MRALRTPAILLSISLFALGARASADALIVYGDSLWDGCDPCAPIKDADVAVLNAARNGAESWHQGICDGGVVPDPDCKNGEDRLLQQGGTGSCLAEDDLDGDLVEEPTCLLDNYPASDAVVLQFGTNDVRSNWTEENSRLPLAQTAWTNMLNEVSSLGLGCIVVYPWPIMQGPVAGDGEDYWVNNSQLRELRDWLEDTELPNHPNCLSVDLYQLFIDYETQNGTPAFLDLYLDCDSKGSNTGDCVHYRAGTNFLGHSPRTMAGEAVLEAAIQLPEPSLGPSLVLGAILVVWLRHASKKPETPRAWDPYRIPSFSVERTRPLTRSSDPL